MNFKKLLKKCLPLFSVIGLCSCNGVVALDNKPTVKNANNPFNNGEKIEVLNFNDVLPNFTNYEPNQLLYSSNPAIIISGFNDPIRYNDYDDFTFTLDKWANFTYILNFTQIEDNASYTIQGIDLYFTENDDLLNKLLFVSFQSLYSSWFEVSAYTYSDAQYSQNETTIYEDYTLQHNLNIPLSTQPFIKLCVRFSDFSFNINEGETQVQTLFKLRIKALDFNINGMYYSNSNLDVAYQNGYNNGYNEGVNNGNNEGYNNGYNVGYSSGYSKGQIDVSNDSYQGKTYQQIYDLGYNNGVNRGSVSRLPSLFGAIVNIPISALNGLIPLTYFDISIVRVVMTILVLNVILYLISYLMSAKG